MQTLRHAAPPLLLLGLAWLAPVAGARETDPAPEPSSLSPGLEDLRRVSDPETRASLLLDSIENCTPPDCSGTAEPLLDEVKSALQLVEDPARRAALLLRLARLLRHLGRAGEAEAALGQALQDARKDPDPAAGLMLRLALALEQAGRSEDAAALWREHGPSHGAVEEPSPAFPFRERPLEGTAGLAAAGTFFTDSTVLASVDLEVYKQWPRHDLQFELLLAAEYDDSRDPRADDLRPQMQQLLVARRHLNADTNLFLDQLTSLNTDTFAADNNDEDTSLLSATLTGVAFNLWRGKDPRSFQELQLGVGARYRYDEINFERVRDEVDPVLGIVYRSRQMPIWLGVWHQTLAVVSPPGDLRDVSLWSSTQLSIPLSKRWSWRNEFVLRYEQRRPGPDYPQLRFQFSTGVNYTF
ncbi:MAG: tetratricopeptide repeat protein [Prochlorococcaceae cyanobacterium]